MPEILPGARVHPSRFGTLLKNGVATGFISVEMPWEEPAGKDAADLLDRCIHSWGRK